MSISDKLDVEHAGISILEYSEYAAALLCFRFHQSSISTTVVIITLGIVVNEAWMAVQMVGDHYYRDAYDGVPAYPSHHRPYTQRMPFDYGLPPPVPASLTAAGPSRSNATQTAYASEYPRVEKNQSKGRAYLESLGTAMNNMHIATQPSDDRHSGRPSLGSDKPLPALPPPPELPQRPVSDHLATAGGRYHHSREPLARPEIQEAPISPKTFRPSPYLILPEAHVPHTPPRRPTSAPNAPSHPEVIDLTLDSPSSTSTPSTPSTSKMINVTPRSPARMRRRGASDQPNSLSTPLRRLDPSPNRSLASVIKSPGSSSPSGALAVRCAGYTRTGERCKRNVKAAAPYLIPIDLNQSDSSSTTPARNKKGTSTGDVEYDDETSARYCKDHAGMICGVEGFYSRDVPGLWVRFEDWIPPELGQQTQTLMRTTMESRLTAKEAPGFIYAYELRDLQTGSTSYFKVGRTDNVPRRIGEWTNQCQSKTPTLRDIFPLSASGLGTSSTQSPLHRQITLNRSFLPGAISSGTLPTSPPNPCVKRWEKLVHLELAEISASARSKEWEELRVKCGDCGKVHKEIFAIPRDENERDGAAGAGNGGEGCYQVVMEVISRWERYTKYSAPVQL